MRWTIEELGVESFEPGDVVLHNDPYRGGAHIPEHSVIRPVFHEGELFGFVANVGHLAEIGGKAVGSFARTRPRSSRRACASRRSRSSSGDVSPTWSSGG